MIRILSYVHIHTENQQGSPCWFFLLYDRKLNGYPQLLLISRNISSCFLSPEPPYFLSYSAFCFLRRLIASSLCLTVYFGVAGMLGNAGSCAILPHMCRLMP